MVSRPAGSGLMILTFRAEPVPELVTTIFTGILSHNIAPAGAITANSNLGWITFMSALAGKKWVTTVVDNLREPASEATPLTVICLLSFGSSDSIFQTRLVAFSFALGSELIYLKLLGSSSVISTLVSVA